ncbi:MAG: glycosyltransferase family 4 protein [Planctomycetes bacterium]|jgi:phosphatidylinositol alpha-1,6-mannosyltransferase|nr:glycosyltransferase family 4 protein [Planctomycetota bacterium]
MRTLLFTLEYQPFKGGVANYYNNLVKFWPKPNNIFVLSDTEKLLNKRIIPVWLPAIWQLFKAIKKYKIDRVIVGQILPLGTVAYFLSFFLSFKYDIVFHGMDFSFACKQERKKKLMFKILKKANFIICANSYTAELIKKEDLKLSGKIKVVNPGVDPQAVITKQDKVQEIKNKYQNSIIILSAGRLVKRKGFDLVMKALSEVIKKTNQKIVYLIIGEGEEKENLEKTKKEILDEIAKITERNKTNNGNSLDEKKANGNYTNNKNYLNIELLGSVSEEDKWQYFQACDIFIMTSRDLSGDFEGFGIVYLEANLVGKPVVAGKAGGVPEAVVNNVNGLLIDSENNKEIIDSLVTLIQDQSLREKLGRQGRERVLQDFSWQNKVKEFYDGLK